MNFVGKTLIIHLNGNDSVKISLITGKQDKVSRVLPLCKSLKRYSFRLLTDSTVGCQRSRQRLFSLVFKVELYHTANVHHV